MLGKDDVATLSAWRPRRNEGPERLRASSLPRRLLLLDRLPRGDELGKPDGRQWRAHPEALEAVAAACVQKIKLLARAHAFGDHLEPQAAREADDRLGNGGILRVGLEVGDERDIDLEGID